MKINLGSYILGIGLGVGLATMLARPADKNQVAVLTDMDNNIGYLETNLPPKNFSELKGKISCSSFNLTCSPITEPINWQKVANAVKGRASGESAKVAAKRALDTIR